MAFDLSSLFNMFPGVGGGNLASASAIPALATAWQHYNQAGQYEDVGNKAAEMASPVSLDTRRMYQSRLNDLYTDPSKFLLGNPEYKANMKIGLDKILAENAARGHSLDGKASNDQLAYMTDLSSRYINQERDDLMNMGGFQFNPAHGADAMLRGSENKLKAQQDALAALLAPLGLATAGNRIGQGNQGGLNGNQGGGGLSDIFKLINPNNMGGGLGSGLNSLSGLFGIGGGYGPGLQELYGNINAGNWNYMAPGWADSTLGGGVEGNGDTTWQPDDSWWDFEGAGNEDLGNWFKGMDWKNFKFPW